MEIYIIEWFDGNENTSEYIIASWKWEERYEEAKKYIEEQYSTEIEIDDILTVYKVSDEDIKTVYKSKEVNN